MLTDVIPAEPVAATETPTVQPENDYSAYVDTFTPEERLKWAQDGEEPAGKPFQKPATPAKEPENKTPAPETAKSEPEPGTGDDDDPEPDTFGTPEQQKAQRTAFSRMRREKAELKAELKLLREQKAEKPAVPAAALKQEPVLDLTEPELPNIDDPKYAGENGAALYNADLKKAHKEIRAYDRALAKQEAEQERKEQTVQSERRTQADQWSKEIQAGRDAHEDFEKVAFSPKVPASLTMLGVIMGMKGGGEIFYQLGKHPEIATALAQDTDIPGNYQTYQELQQAAEKDYRLARQLGNAEGIVRAEAKRLLDGKTGAPKPITQTKAPIPGTRVNASASATGDPIEDAYARGDYALGAKLEAAKDVELKKRR